MLYNIFSKRFNTITTFSVSYKNKKDCTTTFVTFRKQRNETFLPQMLAYFKKKQYLCTKYQFRALLRISTVHVFS